MARRSWTKSKRSSADGVTTERERARPRAEGVAHRGDEVPGVLPRQRTDLGSRSCPTELLALWAPRHERLAERFPMKVQGVRPRSDPAECSGSRVPARAPRRLSEQRYHFHQALGEHAHLEKLFVDYAGDRLRSWTRTAAIEHRWKRSWRSLGASPTWRPAPRNRARTGSVPTPGAALLRRRHPGVARTTCAARSRSGTSPASTPRRCVRPALWGSMPARVRQARDKALVENRRTADLSAQRAVAGSHLPLARSERGDRAAAGAHNGRR